MDINWELRLALFTINRKRGKIACTFTNTCIFGKVPVIVYLFTTQNIVAAFRGMHVSPAKHSYAWLPRKCSALREIYQNVCPDVPSGQTFWYISLKEMKYLYSINVP